MIKLIKLFPLLIFVLSSCNDDEKTVIPDNDTVDDQIGIPSEPISTNVRMFIYGHSLINHEPPAYPTPSNETSVPHWMHFLASESGYNFAANGQYGFLPQHRNLPPISQWGFDHVSSIWDSDVQSFQEADFNTILLTAGNFIQYQPATENYYNEIFSPVNATTEIFQWSQNQDEEISLYIYENWPDMAQFISSQVFEDITAEEFANYNEYTLNDFHQWWLDYHDAIISELPNAEVKLIPVGPILARLLTEVEGLNTIPIISDLYEDDAPHGRPTIYFLAGLVTYMAVYGTQAPADYSVPETVHESVRNNYIQIVDFIWSELESFTDSNGNSRVW
ncbi:MAG: hypothetical protein ACJAZM_002922 [Cyclobacteriaceae bacterium]|jgi:hypothetical protein